MARDGLRDANGLGPGRKEKEESGAGEGVERCSGGSVIQDFGRWM